MARTGHTEIHTDLGKPQKKLLREGGGKGLATKKKELFLRLFLGHVTYNVLWFRLAAISR